MKIFEKFALILFCNIVLIISVLLCVMIFGWVDIRTIGNVIGGWLVGETSSKIILGVCALLIIIAIKCIFFDRGSGDPMRDRPGVLLQNENGKLLISKDTLENLVNSVTNEYKDTKDITTKVELDKDNNVNVLATIVVSNDVIAVIAGVAVSEVSGVASMAGGFAGGISEVLSGKKNMAKGIKVDNTEKGIKIDVNIIVEYGARIPDVAYEIQNRVKKAIENMTGLKIDEINVHIQGVNTSSDNKEKEETEKEEEKIESN